MRPLRPLRLLVMPLVSPPLKVVISINRSTFIRDRTCPSVTECGKEARLAACWSSALPFQAPKDSFPALLSLLSKIFSNTFQSVNELKYFSLERKVSFEPSLPIACWWKSQNVSECANEARLAACWRSPSLLVFHWEHIVGGKNQKSARLRPGFLLQPP